MTDLLRALEEQKQQTEQEVPEITGMLGIPLGGQRRVEVPNRNRYVYVRLRSNQNEVIQAFNDKVAPSYNLPVVLERDGNRYTVVKQDSKRYDNNHNSTSPFLPRHGNTHSFDTESGGGGDVVWVYPRQFMPSLVLPSGSSGADNVIAAPYMLRKNDGSWRHVGNTGTASFTPYKPSSPTGAVMGLVYLDEPSGNPYFLINSGSVFSASLTGTSQVAPFIPSIPSPSTQIPLAAIRLVTGTSVLSWDNIYDVRQFIHTVPTGSSGGGSVTGSFDDTYLRLDTSNGPLTDSLQIRPPQDTRAIDVELEGNGVILDFVQITAPSGTLSVPSAQFSRDEADTNSSVLAPFMKFNQNFDLGGVSNTASLIEYFSNSILRTSINPSAKSTGTMTMFDGDFSLSDDGNLLLLKNNGSPKLKVNALGHIELGLGIPKEPNAGKIGYELVAPGGYLDIIGAGAESPRWVRIYDRLRVEHGQVGSFQVLGLLNTWVYLDATGTAVAPDNAPTVTSVTGSHNVLGLSPANESVRFSLDTLSSYLGISLTPANGWIPVGEVWTRTGDHTFTVPGDLTAKYRKATKIRYNEGSVDEYGVVASSSHAAGTTTVNLIPTFNYAMSGNPSVRYISYIENPEGFPLSFGYIPTAGGSALTLGSGTTSGKWIVVGKSILWWAGFTLAADSSVGSGVFTLTGPTAIQSNGIDTHDALAHALDTGATRIPCFVDVANDGTATIYRLAVSGSNVIRGSFSSTAPFTWATGDKVLVQVKAVLA